MEADDRRPERVVVIVAHPDDAEFICGGTVARWAQEGSEVIYVIATKGQAGSDDLSWSTEELTTIRMKEQRAAAQILGVEEVVFLDHPDGSVVATLALRQDLTREIRQWRPNAVIAMDPTVRYRDSYLNHPDHRAVADAALDAVYPDARNPRQFPSLLEAGLLPHRVEALYLSGAPEPNVSIDITDTIDRKLQALRQHRSQLTNFDELEVRLRERYRSDTEDGNERYIERFRQIPLR
jgi:LmbE family N-acetylglucosaminyl deacetylase